MVELCCWNLTCAVRGAVTGFVIDGTRRFSFHEILEVFHHFGSTKKTMRRSAMWLCGRTDLETAGFTGFILHHSAYTFGSTKRKSLLTEHNNI